MPLTRTPRPHGRTATDHPTAPPSAAPGTGPDARPRPARLFAADAPPAVVPAVLPPADRPPAEHDACARAVGCPDLFVLDAPDRAARERVVADVARAAAGRGERVLVLSPDPAAADRLAEAVAAGHAVKVVRALAPNESPHRPGGVASRLTSAAAGPGRVEQQRREAAAALAGPEAELATLAAAAAVADDLRGLADRFAAAVRDRADLLARRDGLAAAVRAEAGTPFAAELDRRRAAHEAATAPLRAELDAAAARRAEKAAALDAARHPAADHAKKSGLFARLWGRPKPPADPAEHDRLVRDLEREVEELSDREANLRAEVEAADRAFAAERDKVAEAEAVARQAELDARLEALAADRDDAAGRLAVRVKDLDRFGLPAPAQLTPEGVERVAAEVAARRAAAEARRAAVRDKLDELARAGADLARQHLAEARVVVGTPGSVGADPVYEAVGRDLPAGDPPFGLLVLDHAEELTEGDFDGLAPLAGRWVLAGDASPPRPGANGPARGRPPEPGFLARLARRLDRAPWVAEADRLVFRLRHLPPEARRGLAREPVLDRPEVELRFATAGGGEPVLAEVAFPAGVPVLDAKRFLAAEVGEVLLRPCGHPCWSHPDGRPTACWPAAEAGGGPAGWVELEAGVREKVVGHFTAAVAFDPEAGWDATAAADWLAARLPADPGRVASLPRPAGHAPHPHRPVPVGH
jgi:hypothetical protein